MRNWKTAWRWEQCPLNPYVYVAGVCVSLPGPLTVHIDVETAQTSVSHFTELQPSWRWWERNTTTCRYCIDLLPASTHMHKSANIYFLILYGGWIIQQFVRLAIRTVIRWLYRDKGWHRAYFVHISHADSSSLVFWEVIDAHIYLLCTFNTKHFQAMNRELLMAGTSVKGLVFVSPSKH